MKKAMPLKAEIRGQAGSHSAAQIRKQGRIPAIVYGHKKEPAAISLDARSLADALRHGTRLVDVQIGEKPEKMIVKALQYDHLSKDIIHADLMRVDVTETIKIAVPIVLKGTAKGAGEGAIIETHAGHVEVECKVTDIPESITVSVKDLEIGDSIHASDIVLPEGVKLVSNPLTLIATCSMVLTAKTTEELEAEAPAAPEVITEVKETEGEAEKEGEKEKKEKKEKAE